MTLALALAAIAIAAGLGCLQERIVQIWLVVFSALVYALARLTSGGHR